MTREAKPKELQVLWDAVADGDYVDNSSDGRLRWAFLLDFPRQGAAALFPGLVGAIVYAEDELGPTQARLYAGRAELLLAWQATFQPGRAL